MNTSSVLRIVAVGALALLSAGCVDDRYRGGYDDYPRLYRDDDRPRPSDFVGRDRRFRDRYERSDRGFDRNGTRQLGRTPFRVDARGRLAPGARSVPRLRIRHGGDFGQR